MILHAGLIALRSGGPWRGVLILGPSGCGKSDLMLRTMREGFRLVADDRVVVFASSGRLFGRAPDALAGLIEVRGQGVVRAPFLPLAEILLAARCAAPGEAIERMPDTLTQTFLDIALPLLPVAPLEVSAPAKLRRALGDLGGHGQQAYQAALRPLGASPGDRS